MPRAESGPARAVRSPGLQSRPAPRRSKRPARKDRPADFAAAPENLRLPWKALRLPEFLARYVAASAQTRRARILMKSARADPPHRGKASSQFRWLKSDTSPSAAKSPPRQKVPRARGRTLPGFFAASAASKRSPSAGTESRNRGGSKTRPRINLLDRRHAHRISVLHFHVSVFLPPCLRASVAFFFFSVSKRIWMHFPRQLLDRIHQARRRPVYFLAHHRHVPQFDRAKLLPIRARSQRAQFVFLNSGVVAREYDVVRLKARHFLKSDVRPFLLGDDYRLRSSPAQRIRDESILPDRDQRILPHHEQHMHGRHIRETRRQRVEPRLQSRYQLRSLRARSHRVRNSRCRFHHSAHRLRIGGVHRDADFRQRIHRRDAIDRSRRQHQVRMQRDDCFKARVLRPAYVRLQFRSGRRVAIIRVAREPPFESQRVNRLSQIRRQSYHALYICRNRNTPAGFIRDNSPGCSIRDAALRQNRGACRNERRMRSATQHRAKNPRAQKFPPPPTRPSAPQAASTKSQHRQTKSLGQVAQALLFTHRTEGPALRRPRSNHLRDSRSASRPKRNKSSH